MGFVGYPMQDAVGVVFVPTDLTNLIAWLRSDLGITLNGSDVSDWADQGPAGNDFSQGTASKQPAYDSGDVLNGHPGLIPAGSEQLDTGTSLLNGSGDKATFFVVAKSDEVGTGYIISNRTTAGWNFKYINATTIQYQHQGHDQDGHTIVDQFNILEERRDGLESEIGSNGTLDAATTLSGFTADAGSTTSLFAQPAGFNTMVGKCVEIIAYDTNHSDGDMQQVEDYQADRYAIALP